MRRQIKQQPFSGPQHSWNTFRKDMGILLKRWVFMKWTSVFLSLLRRWGFSWCGDWAGGQNLRIFCSSCLCYLWFPLPRLHWVSWALRSDVKSSMKGVLPVDVTYWSHGHDPDCLWNIWLSSVSCQIPNCTCCVVNYVGSEQHSGHDVFLSGLGKASSCRFVAEYLPSVCEAPGKEKQRKLWKKWKQE